MINCCSAWLLAVSFFSQDKNGMDHHSAGLSDIISDV